MISQSHLNTTCGQSVSLWITDLKKGEHIAAERLWGFLHRRLMSYAKNVVRFSPPHYDEEDVAISAFAALCDGLEKGRYVDVDNRTDLWKLLAVITLNKARKRAERESRLKRGGSFSRIPNGQLTLDALACTDLPPELSTSMMEECEKKLSVLQQDELKIVVLLKVEGYTNDEIAKTVGCTRRSIQRRLALIREIWTDSDDEAG